MRLTARPYRAMGLATAIAIAALWTGMTFSYVSPKVPPSFAIVTVAAALYLGAFAVTRQAGQRPPRSMRWSSTS